MNNGAVILHMQRLIDLFAPHVKPSKSLEHLRAMTLDPNLRANAHELFNAIRQKTLTADRRNDLVCSAQYQFEEICAKTLYNLSRPPAPFDPDAPYWIIPSALHLAKCLDMDQSVVTDIVSF